MPTKPSKAFEEDKPKPRILTEEDLAMMLPEYWEEWQPES